MALVVTVASKSLMSATEKGVDEGVAPAGIISNPLLLLRILFSRMVLPVPFVLVVDPQFQFIYYSST